MLARAIARSRGMRLLGAALGFPLPALVRALTHDSFDTGSALLWGTAGYLGGALAAALIPLTRAGEPVRTATLVPRRARDYLPLHTVGLPGVAVSLAVLAAAAYAVTPRRQSAPSSGADMVGSVALSAIAALVTVVGVRWVVRRPQPVPDHEVLAVDDALRSHGLHLVVGTTIVVGFLGAAAASFNLATVTSVGVLQWVSMAVGAAELVLAFVAWGLRTDTWKVRPKAPV